MQWHCNCLVVLILSILQVKCRLNDSKPSFDYLTLSMQWPLGFCAIKKEIKKTCVVPDYVPGWTIHGLWPSSNAGKKDPFNCKGAPQFHYTKIEKLKDALRKYWPDLLNSKQEVSFWEHEYDKHGTCASTMDGFGRVEDYFRQTLNLLHKYSPLDALNKAGIEPREDPYHASEIQAAIERAYGHSVCPQCKDHVISELHVCLDKSLNIIECPKCTVYFKCDGKVYYQPLPGMAKKWSGGTFAFVLVLPGILMYFVLGMLLNTFRGKQGPDIIPHRETIGDIPELIFDGIMFTISVLSCNQEQPHVGGYRDDEAVVS